MLRTAATLLALPLVLAPVAAQELDPAALAPAGRWYVAGGNAARSGQSASPAVLGRPERAWSYAFRGEVESEPLVWDSSVLLSVRTSPQRASLHVVDLVNGTKRIEHVVTSDAPLAPAVWGNRVALKSAPTRLEVFRLGLRRLERHRTFDAQRTLGAPLLYDDRLFVQIDGQLVCQELDRRDASWTATVDGAFHGAPTLRDGLVHAVWYDRRDYAHLASLSIKDGSVTADVVLGRHTGRAPPDDPLLAPAVLADEVFVRLATPLLTTEGQELSTARVRRSKGVLDAADGVTLHGFVTDPVAWGDGWITYEDDAARAPRWIKSRAERGVVQGIVLADASAHADLLHPVPPAVADGVFYLNGLAVDAQSHDILWRALRSPVRPIPARERVLVLDGPSTLVALRPAARFRTRAQELVDAAVAESERELAEGYAALAATALRTSDVPLLRRLIHEAVRREAQSRSLVLAQDGLERLLDSPRAAVPDAARAAAVLESERALIARPLQRMLDRARANPPGPVRRAFLRAILERDPTHAAARADVRALIPNDAPLGPDFDALSWLDFLDAAEGVALTFVGPDDTASDAASERALLEREVREWRRDLTGYALDDLFIVAPPGRPGAVARALKTGQLVCGALDTIFGSRQRPDALPLALLLYESQNEYVTQSQRANSLPELARGWMAGHYSPGERLSRMFVPEDDERSESLLATYAHELTHHWLDTRAPFDAKPRNADTRRLPGFWVVEGFATMIEEFRLDVDAGTWHAENPRAHSLDIVANADPKDLLPWERVLTMTQESLASLGVQPRVSVPLSWRLGVRAPQSEMALFYAQAGALCHFLCRADEAGIERARVLRYLRAFYQGDREDLDPYRALGIAPSEIGQRVVDFARREIGRTN